MSDHKFGMVLVGGGVKGAAHIGVFKALEEHNIKPTYVAGNSAGALAAAFYACGHTAEVILNFMLTNNFFRIGAFTWAKPGLMDMEKFFEVFKPFFEGKTFESLDVELRVVATDIINAKVEVFKSGDILRPIMASCAFPFVFAPVSIGDSLYSDGGILDNFPVETVVGHAEKTLGVYISPLRTVTKEQLTSTVDVLDRIYRISNRYESLKKLKLCNWIINPHELYNYGTFTVSKLKEIYDIGYAYGKEMAPRIIQELDQ